MLLQKQPASYAAVHSQVARKRCFRCSAHLAPRTGGKYFVKICGVTNPEDAEIAASAGADFIGMIMWPKAKRSVSDATAKQIADVAKKHGALPVGVFVDESPDVIISRCNAAGVPVAQLHGDGARSGLSQLQGTGLQIIYVMNATPEGQLVTAAPPTASCDYILLDGLQGGSGQALNWSSLNPPWESARKGWLLAGGLKPDNVAIAASTAHPSGVDVSSGVCGPDGLKKDAEKVVSFVQGASRAS